MSSFRPADAVVDAASSENNAALVESYSKTEKILLEDDVGGGANGASASYQALVERSVTVWNSLNYVGESRTDNIRHFTEIIRDLHSLDALLQHGQFWFFQRKESFINQNLLMKWDHDNLDAYVLLPVEYGFLNNKDCFFISHFWRTREHPDPEGQDLRLFLDDLEESEWSYVWVDWTCLPQTPRNEQQQLYFTRMLRFVPALGRDCAFEWRYPSFEPRAWILFEVGVYVLCHKEFMAADDVKPFVSHVKEMFSEGVRAIVSKYDYVCTNSDDLTIIIGWLELLVILARIVPDVYARHMILDWFDKSEIGSFIWPDLGLKIDKLKGTIRCKGIKYEFTPVFHKNSAKHSSNQ
jgi:hypothetical protein